MGFEVSEDDTFWNNIEFRINLCSMYNRTTHAARTRSFPAVAPRPPARAWSIISTPTNNYYCFFVLYYPFRSLICGPSSLGSYLYAVKVFSYGTITLIMIILLCIRPGLRRVVCVYEFRVWVCACFFFHTLEIWRTHNEAIKTKTKLKPAFDIRRPRQRENYGRIVYCIRFFYTFIYIFFFIFFASRINNPVGSIAMVRATG